MLLLSTLGLEVFNAVLFSSLFPATLLSHKYTKLEDCSILLCSLIVAYCVVYWTPGKEVWA